MFERLLTRFASLRGTKQSRDENYISLFCSLFFLLLQIIRIVMTENRPQILITNDDGYAAKGLRKLVSLMRTLGDVTLVSTDEVMSAKSHSCTIRERIYVRLVREEEGFKEYR